MSKSKGVGTSMVETAALSANKGNYLEEKNSFVNKDRIWRDHVDKMDEIDKMWSENYDYLLTYRKIGTKKQKEKEARMEKLKLEESNYTPRSVPLTTSRMVGWRSTDNDCKLEKFGRYTKPKLSILRSLNWPPEGAN